MFPVKNEVKSNAAVNAFVSSLIRIQHSLYKKETGDWIVARERALDLINPNRYDVVQFYRDIETDLFIRGQKEQRVNRIKNRKVKVVSKSTGDVDKEKTKVLQNKYWFREFIQVVMDAKFHGFRLIYFTVDKKGRPVTKFVYPEHIIPEKGLIVKNPSDVTGVSFTEGPLAQWVIPVGNPESLGLYENLAYAYILRKHSWGSWDEFEELFGVPLRWIKTSATDKKVLDTLEDFAITMGSANYAIVPGNAEMEVKDGRTQDAFQVFNEKRKAVNEEVSMFINGHAEQINEKGSRGKSETIIIHTQDEITKDDELDVLSVVNDELLPMMDLLFGMGFGDDLEVQWDDTKQLEPKEKADMYKTVNDMGFELDQADVENALGVKIIGKKEVKQIPPVPPKPDPNKKDKTPANVYAAYMKLHAEILETYNLLKGEE